MARVRLSQLDNWNLIDQGQEIRGLRLIDQSEQALGLITDMVVDTDAGYVDAVVLDSGQEIPADAIEIGSDVVYLRRSIDTDENATYTGRALGAQGNVQVVESLRVPVVEEELQIGTQQVEGGGVRVRTAIEEVPWTEQVVARDEEINVERRPVHTPIEQAPPDAFREVTYEVRARGQEIEIAKQLYVVEEIHINKAVVEHTETVQATVRRTKVDIEELPESGRTTDPAQIR